MLSQFALGDHYRLAVAQQMQVPERKRAQGRCCAMNRKRAEALLSRINTTLAERKNLINGRRKRISKASSREIAAALQREIDTIEADVEILKVQQKALKRGIIPDDLADDNQSIGSA